MPGTAATTLDPLPVPGHAADRHPGRERARLRRLAFDLLLAAVLTAVSLQEAPPGGWVHGGHLLALLSAPAPLLLPLRHRSPALVCILLAAVHTGLMLVLNHDLGLACALGVALYTLGRHTEPLVSALTAGGLLAVLPLAVWALSGAALPYGFLTGTPVVVVTDNAVSSAVGTIESTLLGTGMGMPIVRLNLLLLLPLAAGILVRQHRQPTARERELERAGRAETERRVLLQERAAIARDLHDSVAHHVSLMVIQAESGPDLVRRGEADVLRGFGVIGDAGRRALAELDRTLAALRDDTGTLLAPPPRLSDLPALVDGTAAQGLAVELVWLGERRELDAPVELSAYRIVQESLTNVVRHAAADSAQVRVEYLPDGLSVEVVDRGAGFDAAAPRATRAGHGLAGMRERARVHGGTLAVASAPGSGTAVSAWLPARA